jgi:hypothetical protein
MKEFLGELRKKITLKIRVRELGYKEITTAIR